jgi:hypothetical protein
MASIVHLAVLNAIKRPWWRNIDARELLKTMSTNFAATVTSNDVM